MAMMFERARQTASSRESQTMGHPQQQALLPHVPPLTLGACVRIVVIKTAVAGGKRRSVLQHLLASHGKSPKNIAFRRALCLAAFATRLSLLVPVFMLWAWGLATVASVSAYR